MLEKAECWRGEICCWITRKIEEAPEYPTAMEICEHIDWVGLNDLLAGLLCSGILFPLSRASTIINFSGVSLLVGLYGHLGTFLYSVFLVHVVLPRMEVKQAMPSYSFHGFLFGMFYYSWYPQCLTRHGLLLTRLYLRNCDLALELSPFWNKSLRRRILRFLCNLWSRL